ncbi:MAG: sigma-70 family RNA polymerase sigma factor [Oscillospiraceae bacterium]|nr:sigma-70 family RNA polymerase sigma factor [Oscillospiraceae bacterium]
MTQEGFSVRVEQCGGKLYQMALLQLGSETAATECMDEAVYRALCGCKKLRQPEYFDTWITRILLNVCSDERRRLKRHCALETLPETAQERFDALPLRQAIRCLPDELGQIVILRYFSGYTLRETAALLQIPQGTAATRQKRALTLLRLALSEEEESL